MLSKKLYLVDNYVSDDETKLSYVQDRLAGLGRVTLKKRIKVSSLLL